MGAWIQHKRRKVQQEKVLEIEDADAWDSWNVIGEDKDEDTNEDTDASHSEDDCEVIEILNSVEYEEDERYWIRYRRECCHK